MRNPFLAALFRPTSQRAAGCVPPSGNVFNGGAASSCGREGKDLLGGAASSGSGCPTVVWFSQGGRSPGPWRVGTGPCHSSLQYPRLGVNGLTAPTPPRWIPLGRSPHQPPFRRRRGSRSPASPGLTERIRWQTEQRGVRSVQREGILVVCDIAVGPDGPNLGRLCPTQDGRGKLWENPSPPPPPDPRR